MITQEDQLALDFKEKFQNVRTTLEIYQELERAVISNPKRPPYHMTDIVPYSRSSQFGFSKIKQYIIKVGKQTFVIDGQKCSIWDFYAREYPDTGSGIRYELYKIKR